MNIDPTQTLSEYKAYPNQIMDYIKDKTGLNLRINRPYIDIPGDASIGLVDSIGRLQISLDYIYNKVIHNAAYFIWWRIVPEVPEKHVRYENVDNATISAIIDMFINVYHKCIELEKEQRRDDIRKSADKYEA